MKDLELDPLTDQQIRDMIKEGNRILSVRVASAASAQPSIQVSDLVHLPELAWSCIRDNKLFSFWYRPADKRFGLSMGSRCLESARLNELFEKPVHHQWIEPEAVESIP